jgi:hypothetical protein
MTPVEPGMQVDPINAWPSLETDLLHAVGRATPSFGMQVGFYYKTFIRPRWAWRYYEKFLRSAAGLGKLDPAHRRTERFEEVPPRRRARIGGGESGLEAAVAARRAARRRSSTRASRSAGARLRASPRADGADLVAGGGRRDREPRLAGGVYEGKLVPVYQGNTMYRFRAGEIVVAPRSSSSRSS